MLTNRQKLFCDLYLTHFDAPRAVEEAGYKKSENGYFSRIAQKVMESKDVKNYIREHYENVNSEKVITQSELLIKLTDIINGNTKETIYPILRSGSHGIFNDEITPFETEIKIKDKIKAMEIMSKIYKLMETGVNANIPKIEIISNIPKNEDVQDGFVEDLGEEILD